MRTVMGFSGGLDSTYVLWKLLSDTNNDVTVIHINYDSNLTQSSFSEYKFGGYDDPCSKDISLIKKQKMLNVLNWLRSNVREFTYEELELEKKYLSKDIPNCSNSYMAFYAAEKINDNIFDEVLFSMEKENDGASLWFSINGSTTASKIFYNKAKRGSIRFPLLDVDYHQGYAIKELPKDLFNLTRSCNHIDEKGNACGVCFKCRKRSFFEACLNEDKSLKEIYDQIITESTAYKHKWISMKSWLIKYDEVYRKHKNYENQEIDSSFFERNNLIRDLPTWPQSFSKD